MNTQAHCVNSWVSAAVSALVCAALLAPSESLHATARPSFLARVEALSGEASWRAPLSDQPWHQQRYGGRTWVPVTRADSFGLLSKLRTGRNGTLLLRLADGSSLKLMHDTEIELLRLRDETQRGVSRVRLERGAIEVNAAGPAADEGAFLVETPAGLVTVGAAAACIRRGEAQPTSAPCNRQRWICAKR